MTGRYLKYVAAFTIPMVAIVSFLSSGWMTFLPLVYVFGLLPIVELLTKPSADEIDHELERKLVQSRYFDWLLYLMVFLQIVCLCLFLQVVSNGALTWIEWLGKTSGMGILCGVIGINVAHELGHRKEGFHQRISQMLLLTSLYMHFFIEHNRGHHKRVATEDDPATARFGESLYFFWWRSVRGSWLSAWKIEASRLRERKKAFFSLNNQMLMFQLIQLTMLLVVYLSFGAWGLFSFVSAAVFGFLLLETVNYIEHYGLARVKSVNNQYERVMPWHSWNSEHPLGRVMLFELSRHSDHHYNASRKYQVLRYHANGPQMPTGYPGMMLLALVPPVWFHVMNPKLAGSQREI